MGLVKAICLHAHKKDHVAHLAPAIAAGLGALLGLETAVVYHAVNQAVHLAFSTRQSRKGQISSWKAFAPAWAGKLAIEAVDRAMRGEGAPNPIYEGEDGVIAWMLAGPDAEYERAAARARRAPPRDPGDLHEGPLGGVPGPGADRPRVRPPAPRCLRRWAARPRGRRPHEPPHARRHRLRLERPGEVRPRRLPRDAGPLRSCTSWRWRSRTAAGTTSTPTRPSAHTGPSTIALWRKIRTVEDPAWTARYHDPDPARKAFGGRVDITLDDGTVVSEERLVADAHPNGRRPWRWPDYLGKLERLTGGRLPRDERERFVDLAAPPRAPVARRGAPAQPALPGGRRPARTRPDGRGIF